MFLPLNFINLLMNFVRIFPLQCSNLWQLKNSFSPFYPIIFSPFSTSLNSYSPLFSNVLLEVLSSPAASSHPKKLARFKGFHFCGLGLYDCCPIPTVPKGAQRRSTTSGGSPPPSRSGCAGTPHSPPHTLRPAVCFKCR